MRTGCTTDGSEVEGSWQGMWVASSPTAADLSDKNELPDKNSPWPRP